MADERTPLIQVVQIRPARDRYPHHTLRHICTTILAIVPVTILAVFLLCLAFPNYLNDGGWEEVVAYFPWTPTYHGMSDSWPMSEGLDLPSLLKIIVETPDAAKAEEWSKYYTSGPHLAGKNLSQALWTKELWEDLGIPKAEIAAYDIYVNYPVDHGLALIKKEEEKEGKKKGKKSSWKVEFKATLEEDVLDEDPTSGLEDRIPTFHGYSASGNVTAPYVFVNYGTYWDFEDLLKANVSLEGKIALAKYGGIFRGLKVKRAQELGMIGAVIYSDPGDDGSVTEENGIKPYPDGPARNPSSVQRGSVQFLSIAPGDPTTPGYPSLPGAPRQDPHHSIPSIPSIPISYKEALPLLKALNGHGPSASSFNKYWGGGGLRYKGVDYNIGPTPDSLVINIYNKQEYVTTPMWNVIGIINGSMSDEVVVLGNHRDAWIAGGASDPNSGSAAMNEVVRGLGKALKAGWKPLRTIVLASWDGEEYGLLGSTEWVEEYFPWLAHSAIAYFNVDVGTRGTKFATAAAPLLNKLIIETVHAIPSPNKTANQTVGDTWDHAIYTMGSGSDFTAFQDFVGIPSVDMGFDYGPDAPVYHYHSNYDSFAWMKNFGDPSFEYHATIARIWGLMAVTLVEKPVLAFNATTYADALQTYLDRLKAKIVSSDPADHNNLDAEAARAAKKYLRPIDTSLARLRNASVALDARAAALEAKIDQGGIPWWKWWERVRLFYRVRAVNNKYKLLERQFLYPRGLDGRPWFKHIVFAPGKWTGYSGATFPGLVEAAEEGDKKALERWAGIVHGIVDAAAAWLEK